MINRYENKNLTDAELKTLHELQDLAQSKRSWIKMMDLIHESFSEVMLKQGKTPTDVIANSLVGKCYFAKFREWIEAEQSNGGLGLKSSSWVAINRAYRLVLEHEYLRNCYATVSEINTVAAIKDISFPSESYEYKQLTVFKSDGRRPDNSKDLADTRNEINKLNIRNSELFRDYENEQIRNSELNKQLTSLQEQNTALTSENVRLRETASKIGDMGFLQRLLFVFKSQ